MFGRLAEEIFGMVREELVERIGRGDQHRRGGIVPAPRAPRLLPRGRDASRVADEDRRAQPADVYAQFEGVGRDDETDGAVAQASLNFASLGGEVAGAIAADG